MRRQKRNADGVLRNGYQVNPEFRRHPQQQKYQHLQTQNKQQEPVQAYKYDTNSNNPSVHPVQYGTTMEENSSYEERDPKPIQNIPRQMSPQAMGHEKKSNNDEEDNQGPRYEFNYDIPKDSFQSDVINGQFSTFAKLPMSFESLIQSDASFLDSLAEQPPENIDRSITKSYNNVPSPYTHPPTSQMRNAKNEKTNTDDSDYDSEVYEPPPPPQPPQRQPVNQMQYSQPNQFRPPNQQYYPPTNYAQNQKFLQHSPPPVAKPVELPVYVVGTNEQPEGYEYENVKPHGNQRPNFPHQLMTPLRKAPPLKGLIRQASQAFRQPYQERFMERSSVDYPEPQNFISIQQPRTNVIHRHKKSNLRQYPNFASEQRNRDMMVYYTTTPPPPPPPQKVVNAQLQVIKNGIPTLPALPKQLSINYISGPPPPPPPPKDPYGMMSYTTPAPPPPPPPPRPYYERSRRPHSTYERVMDQMWDKYTTTPPPPPPSKVIQFGLNFR